VSYCLDFYLNPSSLSSAFTSLELRLEQQDGSHNSVNLAYYAPVIEGAWHYYSIPLSDFMTARNDYSGCSALDLKTLTAVGLWNPLHKGTPITGPYYLDDVAFNMYKNLPPSNYPDVYYVYSEEHGTNSMFGTLTVSGESDHGDIVTTLDSTAVAEEGTKSFLVTLPSGNAWGVGSLVFGSAVDLSAYTSLTFSINTAGLTNPSFTSFEIKLEEASTTTGKDSGETVPKGNSMNMHDYTPAINGDWATYTIPLNDFKTAAGIGWDNLAIDLLDVSKIGFRNPHDTTESLTGTFYVDDVFFTK
jgi:hypothetical protein